MKDYAIVLIWEKIIRGQIGRGGEPPMLPILYGENYSFYIIKDRNEKILAKKKCDNSTFCQNKIYTRFQKLSV